MAKAHDRQRSARPHDASLEREFHRPQRIKIDGTTIDLYDLRPAGRKTDVPTIVVPGWGATAHIFHENVIGLAARGRRVVIASAPHGVEPRFRGPYPSVVLRKAQGVLAALDHAGVAVADAVSHSEGAVLLAVAAAQQPERFRNFVFVSPAGLVKSDSLPRLGFGFSYDVLRQWTHGAVRNPAHARRSLRAMRAAMKTWATDPKSTWAAIRAMVRVEIPDLLRRLKRAGHGVAIIHGTYDKAFPVRRIRHRATADMADEFIVVRGSHNEMYLNPRLFTELIDRALDRLEKKYAAPPA